MKSTKKSIFNVLAISVMLLVLCSCILQKDDKNNSGSNILEFKMKSKIYEIAPYDLEKGTWEEANQQAQSLRANGHSDWRLPTADELDIIFKTAYRKGRKNGNIIYQKGHTFKGGSDYYWSSEKSRRYAGEIVIKNFYTGKKATFSPRLKAHARCIRLKSK